MKKKIKDIYNWDKIDNPETNLLKQINSIIDKTPDDLTCSDICLLLRQEMFLDIVIPKAIIEIENNPKVGDFYDFQMLVNLSSISEQLIPYKEKVRELITVLEEKAKKIVFELDSDKDDFNSSIKTLKQII